MDTYPIEIVPEGGVTLIRMPASEKPRQIVKFIRDKIEQLRKAAVSESSVDLSATRDADKRTSFFTKLIVNIEGFSLETVTNLSVATWRKEDEEGENTVDDDDDENGDDAAAKAHMLAAVESVAIKGTNLVATEQYQSLRKGGFFLTAITWRARALTSPHDMVEFDASFDNGLEGTGFKYGMRYSKLLRKGEYAKGFRPVEENRKPGLFELIESAARKVAQEVLAESDITRPEVTEGERA
jgi:hypothetical protein